jgi:hypothetical protein
MPCFSSQATREYLVEYCHPQEERNLMKSGIKNLGVFIVSDNKFGDREVAELVHWKAQPSEGPGVFPFSSSAFFYMFAFVFISTSFIAEKLTHLQSSPPHQPQKQKNGLLFNFFFCIFGFKKKKTFPRNPFQISL